MTATVRFCERDVAVDETRLDCVNTAIEDLSPLRALTHLRELRLLSTNPHEVIELRVVDLGPLAALTQLEVLEIAGTAVADLSALAGLTQLRRLDLARTR